MMFKKIRTYIFDRFDARAQAKALGVSLWQTPLVLTSFLFLVVIFLIFSIFVFSETQTNPSIFFVLECMVISALFFAGLMGIRAMKQAAKVNKLKSEFISIASHQLKNPLAQMKWLLNSIEFQTLEEKQRYGQKISLARKSNEMMIQLIDDLLDAARMDRGEMSIQNEKIDFLEIVQNVLNSYTSTIRKKRLKLGLSANFKTKKIPIYIDRRRIEVVVDNLVRNALMYTRENGEVHITVEKKSQELSFSIRDTGIGVPKYEQDKIFQRFYRAGNAKKESIAGTGLGLYLTKGIVEQCGGRVTFHSVEGKGSVFSFTLPLRTKELI